MRNIKVTVVFEKSRVVLSLERTNYFLRRNVSELSSYATAVASATAGNNFLASCTTIKSGEK